MKDGGKLLHGTCVALEDCAALLRGPSGAGKSDLALRFVLETPTNLCPQLVADDQVLIFRREPGELLAQAPASIRGRIEVRGVGIVALPFVKEARLVLVVDLVDPEEVPRLPPEPEEEIEILGVSCPLLKLAPFEASAPLKLSLALQARRRGMGRGTRNGLAP